ncbi:hypothetical protein F4781DRAFT_222781 [Annulohypoxylon bovei var. microspora]|nr:hypothetical protein F4781DRAFT_222781 [Annulohypoxylon bovei var. microspora]
MAQGSNGWQGHSYPNGIGGMPVSQNEDQLNNFNNFQQYGGHQYGQPNLSQYSNASSFSGYPSLQSEGQFGGGAFAGGDMAEQTSYYPGTHQFSNDSNGSGLHGHGGHDLQQYGGASFNNHAGYETSLQNQLPPQYVAEQASQSHSHTPNTFGAQPWPAQSVQQLPPQFNQGTIGYNHHNPQLMYHPQHQQHHQSQHQLQPQPQQPLQQQPQPQPQQQQPQPQQQQQHHQVPYTRAFFGAEGVDAQNRQGHFTPQPSQPMLHYQGRQHVNGVGTQLQPIAVTAPQAFAETQRPIHPQHYQQMRGVVSAATPGHSSQATQIVGHQVPNEEPKAGDGEVWEAIEGVPFLLIKNPPKTKVAKFSTLKPTLEKPYVAKLDTRVGRMLPQRNLRLACEIRKDIQDLTTKLRSSTLSTNERSTIENSIQQLYDERIIVVDNEGSKPVLQDTKPKAPTKRKPSTMDSNKKSGRLGTGSDDEEDPMDTLAREILLKPRPGDAYKAVEYDIVEILWRDPKRPELSPDDVTSNIYKFGDYVTTLRTKIKMLKDGKSGDGKGATNPGSLQSALDTKYLEIRAAVEAAIKFGDKFTITQLGTHKKLVAGLYSFLQTCFSANDYNGTWPKVILRLLSLFITVDTEFLERVKLSRLQQKYKDNLDDEAAKYISLIFENAAKRSASNAQEAIENVKKVDDVKKPTSSVSKKTSTTSARDIPSTSKASPSKNESQLKKISTGVKKMRPTDYSGLGSARKISNLTAKTTPSQGSPKRPGDEGVDTRALKKTAVESETGTPSTARATSTTTPTSSQASSAATTQARSRPSGSMLPGRSRIIPKAQPKKAVPQPSTTSSTIGNILAEISKPKEVPKPRDEPERPPETPEETVRRLRKESRRHLRVSWKPDDELTEIRILEHDTSEDRGRDHNMLRDARDNRSEGRMFKQQLQDQDTQDRDDDFEESQEVAIQPWSNPTLVAFGSGEGGIPVEKQETNLVTRGGKRLVESEQKKIMEDYESRELMAIYTSVSEIPDTPRSPSGKFVEVARQPKILVLPSTPAKWLDTLPAITSKRVELHQRSSDHIKFGPHLAIDRAIRRLKATPITAPELFQNNILNMARPRTEKERADDVLSLLKSDKVKNYVDPDPYDPAHPKTHRRNDYADPKVQRDADALEDVFAKFKGMPYPATQPPQHIQPNSERATEWYDGYNRDLMASAQPQQQQSQANFYQTQSQQQQPQLPQGYAAILQQVQALQANQAAAQPAVQPVAQPVAQYVPTVQAPQSTTEPAPNQATIEVRRILAALSATSGTSLPTPTPPPAPILAPPPAPVAAPAPTPNIQDILAMLNQSNNATANQAQPAANAYYQGWPQAQAQPQTQAQPSQGYGSYGYNYQSYGGQSQPSQLQSSQPQALQTQSMPSRHDDAERGSRKEPRAGTKDHKGINRSLIGTKPCTFWAKGQCAKGDKCTFRHDPNDLK